MGLFKFLRKKEKDPPKEVKKVFAKMDRFMEGRKLADEAISYRNVGNYDKAFRLFEISLRDFNYTPAITLIGTTKVLQGDINGALKWFMDKLNTVSADEYPIIEFYANVGSIYNKYLSDYSKAVKMYEKALKMPRPYSISEDNYRVMVSMVHHDMAIVYKNLGNLSLASKYAKLRLEVVPDCSDCLELISSIAKTSLPTSTKEESSPYFPFGFVDRFGCAQSIPANGVGLLRALWRSCLDRLISGGTRENASKELQTDLNITMKWLGVESVGEINEPHFEKFIQGFEFYFREKKTPIAAMWSGTLQALLGPEQTAPYKGTPLNEEICGVMDRLIGPPRSLSSVRATEKEASPRETGVGVGSPSHLDSQNAPPRIDLPASLIRVLYRKLISRFITDATKEEATVQLKADLQITMKWLEVDSVRKIVYDRFRYGVEGHIMERATLAARMWYEAFPQARLDRPYSGIPLNEEIRGVMDRLIGFGIKHLSELLESIMTEADYLNKSASGRK